MSEALKQSFSTAESTIVISMGVVSGCIAALQPILLGGLLEQGQLDVVQMGQAATSEATGMALATTLAATFLKPAGLKRIAAVALMVALAANAGTAFGEGLGIILLRGLNGLCSGVLLWILLGLLARSAAPGRAFAIYVTSQAVISFLFSLLISNWLVNVAGAAGGYALFAIADLALLLSVWRMPAAYNAGSDPSAFSAPPLTGVLGLIAVGLFIAAIMGFWVYVLPLGKELGYPEEHLKSALSMAIAAQIAAGLCAIMLASKLRPFVACLMGTAVIAACAFVFMTQTTLPALYVSLVVFSFIWMFVPPFQLPLVIEFDPSLRSAIFIGTAQLSGVALGPILSAQFISGDSSLNTVYSCYAMAILSLVFLVAANLYSSKKGN